MSRADLFSAARVHQPSPGPTPRAAPIAETQDHEGDDDDHLCRVCGAPGGFGFGVFLRRGLKGRWACLAHRAEVEAMP